MVKNKNISYFFYWGVSNALIINNCDVGWGLTEPFSIVTGQTLKLFSTND